jgi:hypothetical protein
MRAGGMIHRQIGRVLCRHALLFYARLTPPIAHAMLDALPNVVGSVNEPQIVTFRQLAPLRSCSRLLLSTPLRL